MHALALAQRDGPFQGVSIRAPVIFSRLRAAPRYLRQLIWIDGLSHDAAPGASVRHLCVPEMEERLYVLAPHLRPARHGSATRLACQLGQNADRQDLGQRILPALLSSSAFELSADRRASVLFKQQRLIGMSEGRRGCLYLHQRTVRLFEGEIALLLPRERFCFLSSSPFFPDLATALWQEYSVLPSSIKHGNGSRHKKRPLWVTDRSRSNSGSSARGTSRRIEKESNITGLLCAGSAVVLLAAEIHHRQEVKAKMDDRRKRRCSRR